MNRKFRKLILLCLLLAMSLTLVTPAAFAEGEAEPDTQAVAQEETPPAPAADSVPAPAPAADPAPAAAGTDKNTVQNQPLPANPDANAEQSTELQQKAQEPKPDEEEQKQEEPKQEESKQEEPKQPQLQKAPANVPDENNGNEGAAPVCNHVWDEGKVTTEPTCTEAGEKTYTCTNEGCSATKTEPVPATGHTSGGWVPAAEDTCTEPGHSGYYLCTGCDTKFADDGLTNSIPNIYYGRNALGHTGAAHVDAKTVTCTDDGNVEYYECTRCSAKFADAGMTQELSDVIVKANGHDWSDWTVISEATCAKKGSKTHACKACDAVENIDIPTEDHDLVHNPAQAEDRCKQGNVEYWACKKCGRAFMDAAATVPATGNVIIPGSGVHSPVEQPAKAATCTDWGNKLYYKCSVCGAAFEDADCRTSVREDSKMIAPGHDLKLVSGKTPTCTKSGIREHYKCAVCGKMFDMDKTTELTAADISIAPTGHVVDWSKAKVTQKGTCTTDEISVAKCENKGCSEKLTRTVKAPGHNWTVESSVEAACTKDGKTVLKCTECGKTRIEVLKAAHDWQEDPADPGTTATCTADGKVNQLCLKCGKTRTVTERAGHKWMQDYDNSVYATCTKAGKLALKCRDCDATKTETIPAAGHKVSVWYVHEPNCTTDGFKSGQCSACQEMVTTKLSALGHQYTAECENKWNHVLTCERAGCKHKETEPHNYGQWYKVDKNSDDKTATWRRDCEDCGWSEFWTQDLAASPRTGDENNVAVYSLVCVLTLSAAGAAAFILKKKENG